MAHVLVRIRALSVWSVLAAIFVLAIAFGLRPWVIAVAVFGLVYAGINRALSDRIAERFERQPDLALQVAVGGGGWANSPPASQQPWPFYAETIINAEKKRLAEEGDAYENMAKGPTGLFLRGALTAPPSAAAYERARRTFDNKVDEHADALRQWLADYRDQADQRARTFELDLRVTAGHRGAYAEDVSLVLALPAGAEIVDRQPTISSPPEPPTYESPPSRPLFGAPEFVSTASLVAPLRVPSFDLGATLAKVSVWTIDENDSRATASLGSVHHGSSVRIREPLLVRVPSTGRFEIAWTLLAKNSRRHVSGTLALLVSEAESRPAFRRLQGIKAFPDVAFVNDDGDVVQEPRTEDPPIAPPQPSAVTGSTGDAVLDRLRQRHGLLEWQRLGLGEDEDEGDQEDQSAVDRRPVTCHPARRRRCTGERR
jgi:hypothetical protein